MDTSIILQILVLIALLGLSGFFSSTETAMTTVNRLRIRTLAEAGQSQAVTMMKILDQSDKMLSVILIGNNLVNITASSMATTLTMHFFGNGAVSISTGLLTLFVLIFGEISPKTIAAAESERLSLRYASIIWKLMYVMTPLVVIVNFLAGLVLKLRRHNPAADADAVTEADIRTLVDAGREEGVLEEQEHEIINNVFDFGDVQVREVMVPRAEMITVQITDTYQDAAELFRTEKLSRLPVYKDNHDDIIGVINLKDFVFIQNQDSFRIQDIMYEPYYTYENKKISELLLEMRKNSIGLTIVLDEYGSATGMVTMEDLLEELVGQIRDEYDDDEDQLIRRISDRTYLIEGSVNLDDVNDELGLHLESEDYDSIGGLIIDLLEQLPRQGQSVTTEEGVVLTVVAMKRNRIQTIRLVMPRQSAEPENTSE